MPSREKQKKEDNRNRISDKKNPVVVDIKDDMSDPVKGLPKARG